MLVPEEQWLTFKAKTAWPISCVGEQRDYKGSRCAPVFRVPDRHFTAYNRGVGVRPRNMMTARKLAKVSTAVSLLTLVGMAAAQGKAPFKTETVPLRQKLNTSMFVPQINPTRNATQLERSENPRKVMPRGEPNTLPVGGVIAADRGQVQARFAGIGPTGYVPPDNDMGVGPNHIILVVNTDLAFYSKTGTKTFQQNFATFFASLIKGGIISDPKVFYDVGAKRWFMSILNADFDAKTSNQLIAVSDDTTPDGNWSLYSINTKFTYQGKDYWLDYPGYGYNRHSILMSGNMFGFENGFAGTMPFVIDKGPMLTGGTTSAKYFHIPDAGTLQLARTYSTTENIGYGLAEKNSTSLYVVAFTGLPGSPQMTTTTLAVPNYNFPPPGRSAGNRFLDSLDNRLFNLHWRNGSLVSAHGVDTGTGGVSARWYEIKTNGWPASTTLPTRRQVGQISGNSGTDNFVPAITINANGDIGMVYTRSGPSRVADIMFAGRVAADPLNQMGTPKVLKASVGSSYGFPGGVNRWGDYFGADVDPADNTSMWFYSMYGNGTDWDTAFFKVSAASAVPTPFAPSASSKVEGGTTTSAVSAMASSDNVYYSLPSVAVQRTGEVASVAITYQTTQTPATTQNLSLKLEALAGTGVNSLLYLWNYNTGTWTHIAASPLGETETTKTTIFGARDYTPFISNGQVKILVRAISSTSMYRPATPFTLKIDQAQLLVDKKTAL